MKMLSHGKKFMMIRTFNQLNLKLSTLVKLLLKYFPNLIMKEIFSVVLKISE